MPSNQYHLEILSQRFRVISELMPQILLKRIFLPDREDDVLENFFSYVLDHILSRKNRILHYQVLLFS